MVTYECQVCGNIIEEQKAKWENYPADWVCPICQSNKTYYNFITSNQSASVVGEEAKLPITTSDEIEEHLNEIQRMAKTGESIIEPMKTKKPVLGWDDILIKGAQLATIPLNKDEDVNVRTVIGPYAKLPLVINTPIIITHMSFGALSKEAKIALAKGSAAVQTATCSGEGGILKDSMELAYKYIFEYVPNRYSVTEENLKKVDAIEIKLGQSVKPGLGGHLPGAKVTKEITQIRGFPEGMDIFSPASFPDVKTQDDLKQKVEWLRKKSGGKPIGIKLAAGNIEADLEIAVGAKPDFITLDGRGGATGAAPKFVKDATSVPTLFALHRARKFLDKSGIQDISLVITGGLRVSSDFVKALALGADVVAIGTAALIAIGCEQFRLCNTGECPKGITTQDPELRAKLDIEASSKGLENFLNVSTKELKEFARLTGKKDVHDLTVSDLCTANSEISDHTDIEHM